MNKPSDCTCTYPEPNKDGRIQHTPDCPVTKRQAVLFWGDSTRPKPQDIYLTLLSNGANQA